MRKIVFLSLFVLFIGHASAQHRGGASRGGFGSRRGGSLYPYGLPFGGPGYGGLGYGGFGYVGLPLPDDGYLSNQTISPYEYQPQPIFVVQQPPRPPVTEPPREVHPVIVDYAASGSFPSPPPESASQPFGIVLKDGSIRSAKAVVVVLSDGVLQYVDPDERHVRISMSDVDREATRKLNRERKLTLWLPAAPDPTNAPAADR